MKTQELKQQIISEITGEKGMHLTNTWEQEIDDLISEVTSLSTFNPVSRQEKCVYGEVSHQITVGDLTFESKSLSRYLEGSQSCVIMAATLGPRIESRMGILQMTNMSKAYLFDIVCLHYLESLLDDWEENMRHNLAENAQYLSGRFSPGYGDLPLEIQSNVLNYLDAQKRIGIELTENNLMIPQKSVTAVLGISSEPFKRTYSRCDACLKRENCKNRGGRHCEFH